MPLEKGKSPKVAIREMIAAGHPPAQAVAAAYRQQAIGSRKQAPGASRLDHGVRHLEREGKKRGG